MAARKFRVGDRVVRARNAMESIKIGDTGTVSGYSASGSVLVIYDRRANAEAKQSEQNLELVSRAALVPAQEQMKAPPTVRPDPAFVRDGYATGAALQLEEKLRAERAVVQPPRGAGRWTFRREWRKAAPTVHGAFMGLARILRGL